MYQYHIVGIEEKKELTVKDSEENSGNCDTSDILLWAIFANRKEIAEICWLRGKDPLRKFKEFIPVFSLIFTDL